MCCTLSIRYQHMLHSAKNVLPFASSRPSAALPYTGSYVAPMALINAIILACAHRRTLVSGTSAIADRVGRSGGLPIREGSVELGEAWR